MKHTPGPWMLTRKGANMSNLIYGPSGQSSYEGDDGLRVVATYQACCPIGLLYNEERDNALANARLIAAAPRMYAFVVKKAGEGDEEARAIIAKAEGET